MQRSSLAWNSFWISHCKTHSRNSGVQTQVTTTITSTEIFLQEKEVKAQLSLSGREETNQKFHDKVYKILSVFRRANWVLIHPLVIKSRKKGHSITLRSNVFQLQRGKFLHLTAETSCHSLEHLVKNSLVDSWKGVHTFMLPSSTQNHFRLAWDLKSLAYWSWAQQGTAQQRAQQGTWKCTPLGCKCCPASRHAAHQRDRARSTRGKPWCFTSLSLVPLLSRALDRLHSPLSSTGEELTY